MEFTNVVKNDGTYLIGLDREFGEGWQSTIKKIVYQKQGEWLPFDDPEMGSTYDNYKYLIELKLK